MIPSNRNLLLDISPPKLRAIVIEGSLIFKDVELNLHSDFIFVKGGRLVIGTENKPFKSKAIITLYGNK